MHILIADLIYDAYFDRSFFLFTQNVCASNPCFINSHCQTGFTEKGYRCICSVGFTGEDCSIGKKNGREIIIKHHSQAVANSKSK